MKLRKNNSLALSVGKLNVRGNAGMVNKWSVRDLAYAVCCQLSSSLLTIGFAP